MFTSTTLATFLPGVGIRNPTPLIGAELPRGRNSGEGLPHHLQVIAYPAAATSPKVRRRFSLYRFPPTCLAAGVRREGGSDESIRVEVMAWQLTRTTMTMKPIRCLFQPPTQQTCQSPKREPSVTAIR